MRAKISCCRINESTCTVSSQLFLCSSTQWVWSAGTSSLRVEVTVQTACRWTLEM